MRRRCARVKLQERDRKFPYVGPPAETHRRSAHTTWCAAPSIRMQKAPSQKVLLSSNQIKLNKILDLQSMHPVPSCRQPTLTVPERDPAEDLGFVQEPLSGARLPRPACRRG